MGGNARVFFVVVVQNARPSRSVKRAKERAVRAFVGQRRNLMDEGQEREPARLRAHLGGWPFAEIPGIPGSAV